MVNFYRRKKFIKNLVNEIARQKRLENTIYDKSKQECAEKFAKNLRDCFPEIKNSISIISQMNVENVREFIVTVV